jgi:hypothetical protein
MKRITLALVLILLLTIGLICWFYLHPKQHDTGSTPTKTTNTYKPPLPKLKAYAQQAKTYIRRNGLNQQLCFMIDMGLHSGRNRFFVYDLTADTILHSGLVAHGSCNTSFLQDARFSNTVGCGCSAQGRYRIGYRYKGQFGFAYKLYGLDTSNNHAFERNIVLHAYDCVPDTETYPAPICNSLGCTMVSYVFLNRLTEHIQKSTRPILLWMFN